MNVEITDGAGHHYEEEERRENSPNSLEEFENELRVLSSENPEWQFVVLLGYFIYKYCEGEAVLDHAGFADFMKEEHSLERIDEEDLSIYRIH